MASRRVWLTFRQPYGLVLPGIPDEQDACVARLISPLKSNDIDQAHVGREAEHAGWRNSCDLAQCGGAVATCNIRSKFARITLLSVLNMRSFGHGQ